LKNEKPKNCKAKNRWARPSHFAISDTKSHNCPVYHWTCCCQGVSHPLLVFPDCLRRKRQVLKVHVSFMNKFSMLCTLCPCLAYKQAKISNKRAECYCPSSVHVSKGTHIYNLFLPDISNDNKHLAFEVTTKVAFSWLCY